MHIVYVPSLKYVINAKEIKTESLIMSHTCDNHINFEVCEHFWQSWSSVTRLYIYAIGSLTLDKISTKNLQLHNTHVHIWIPEISKPHCITFYLSLLYKKVVDHIPVGDAPNVNKVQKVRISVA